MGKIRIQDNRTLELIRNHFEVEKSIAERLETATQEERKEICNRFKFVYGIDISDQRDRKDTLPDNFHPEDTLLHFALVRRILKPKSVYVFRTPHRFSGRHDISRYFCDVTEGFHLKEWTFGEIVKILKELNYSSWFGYWFARGIRIKIPFYYFIILEHILSILPNKQKRALAKYFLPCITMVAIK
ncbi:hypothetical protein KAU34_05710 [candidate division WOR-3 bacterium]|nr:hypothetical protein [candidate division WOR-3 bacterium]